jgi:hypothetical protein
MALRCRHIDLERRIVRVEGSVSEVAGALVIGPPKSATGVPPWRSPRQSSPCCAYTLRGRRAGTDGRLSPVRRRDDPAEQLAYRLATCVKVGVEDLHCHD